MSRRVSSLGLAWWLVFAALFLGPTGCSGPDRGKGVAADSDVLVADPEFSRAMAAGRAAFDRGLTEQAATFYRRALMRARAIDNASAIGNAAYNLSACYISQGKHERARALLEEAKGEFSRSQGNIADILLVEAKVARLQGNPDEALVVSEQVLSHRASLPTDGHRLQVYLLRGHIACDKGDIGPAFSELQTATKYANEVSDPSLHAGLLALEGRIYLGKNEPERAAKKFDNEATLLRKAERHREMVRALRSAAAAYMSAGDTRAGADRFFRASRSMFAQGEREEALKLGKMALSAAEAADDQLAIARTRALLDEIEGASASQIQ
jgi:tetratricopeptide (TPR) repeat protein